MPLYKLINDPLGTVIGVEDVKRNIKPVLAKAGNGRFPASRVHWSIDIDSNPMQRSLSGCNGLEKHIALTKDDVVVIADSSTFPPVKPPFPVCPAPSQKPCLMKSVLSRPRDIAGNYTVEIVSVSPALICTGSAKHTTMPASPLSDLAEMDCPSR